MRLRVRIYTLTRTIHSIVGRSLLLSSDTKDIDRALSSAQFFPFFSSVFHFVSDISTLSVVYLIVHMFLNYTIVSRLDDRGGGRYRTWVKLFPHIWNLLVIKFPWQNAKSPFSLFTPKKFHCWATHAPFSRTLGSKIWRKWRIIWKYSRDRSAGRW